MKCFSCGADVEDVSGETHPYMLSAPGCWNIYQAILQKEYSDPRLLDANQYTVDAYAVQHYGRKEVPQAVSSVGIHLSSLYMLLSGKIKPREAAKFKREIANYNKQTNCMVWLSPPPVTSQVTVNDVQQTTSVEEHNEVAIQWARTVWDAWTAHHVTIEKWIQNYLSSLDKL